MPIERFELSRGLCKALCYIVLYFNRFIHIKPSACASLEAGRAKSFLYHQSEHDCQELHRCKPIPGGGGAPGGGGGGINPGTSPKQFMYCKLFNVS